MISVIFQLGLVALGLRTLFMAGWPQAALKKIFRKLAPLICISCALGLGYLQRVTALEMASSIMEKGLNIFNVKSAELLNFIQVIINYQHALTIALGLFLIISGLTTLLTTEVNHKEPIKNGAVTRELDSKTVTNNISSEPLACVGSQLETIQQLIKDLWEPTAKKIQNASHVEGKTTKNMDERLETFFQMLEAQTMAFTTLEDSLTQVIEEVRDSLHEELALIRRDMQKEAQTETAYKVMAAGNNFNNKRRRTEDHEFDLVQEARRATPYLNEAPPEIHQKKTLPRFLLEEIESLEGHEALKKIQEYLRKESAARKPPMFLTDEEKQLSLTELSRLWKLQEQQRRGVKAELRPVDYEELPDLSSEEQQLPRTTIKSIIRSRKNEMWIRKMIAKGVKLVECPTCHQIVTETHQCLPTKFKSTKFRKGGLPVTSQVIVSTDRGGTAVKMQNKTIIDQKQLQTEYEELRRIKEQTERRLDALKEARECRDVADRMGDENVQPPPVITISPSGSTTGLAATLNSLRCS